MSLKFWNSISWKIQFLNPWLRWRQRTSDEECDPSSTGGGKNQRPSDGVTIPHLMWPPADAQGFGKEICRQGRPESRAKNAGAFLIEMMPGWINVKKN